MPLVVITPPVSRDLVTWERVQQEIPELDDEVRALALIREATSIIERECGYPRGFGLQTVEERVPADGGVELPLEMIPIAEPDAARVISYLGGSAITDYEILDPHDGYLYRENGWEWSVGNFSSVLGTRVPRPGRFDFTVLYRAGYVLPNDDDVLLDAGPPEVFAERLPYGLERAAIELVRALMTAPQAAAVSNVASERIGDYSISYRDSGGDRAVVLPPRVETLLAPFRRVF